jgi:hypothetical protein
MSVLTVNVPLFKKKVETCIQIRKKKFFAKKVQEICGSQPLSLGAKVIGQIQYFFQCFNGFQINLK